MTDGFKTFDSRSYLRKKLRGKIKKYKIIKHDGIESIRKIKIQGKNKFLMEKKNVMENYGSTSLVFKKPFLTPD